MTTSAEIPLNCLFSLAQKQVCQALFLLLESYLSSGTDDTRVTHLAQRLSNASLMKHGKQWGGQVMRTERREERGVWVMEGRAGPTV